VALLLGLGLLRRLWSLVPLPIQFSLQFSMSTVKRNLFSCFYNAHAPCLIFSWVLFLFSSNSRQFLSNFRWLCGRHSSMSELPTRGFTYLGLGSSEERKSEAISIQGPKNQRHIPSRSWPSGSFERAKLMKAWPSDLVGLVGKTGLPILPILSGEPGFQFRLRNPDTAYWPDSELGHCRTFSNSTTMMVRIQ